MNQPFRFIHASDFHLERPPRGLAEVPDHLRGAFVEAPYRAAERVFDAAIKERVDFVILSGDLIDPRTAGPRGIVFLNEQFSRMAEKDVKVYWAGGRSDDFERWVDHWPLPKNVIRFALQRVERVLHERYGQPLLQILGTSTGQRKKIRPADFHAPDGDLFALAVAYGVVDAQLLSAAALNFWALGGEHDRRAVVSAPAQFAGSPQGRRPQESGPHGCTLVQVDEALHIRTSFIPTDAIRYLQERVALNESSTAEQLQQILHERVTELLADPFGPELLIYWTITGSQALARELRRGKLAGDLVTRLRAEHGQKRPAAWTVSIESEPTLTATNRYEEETVLGEFLRTIQHYVEHPEEALSLEPYLTERHLAGSVGPAVALTDTAERNRVLAEAARLGLELLGAEERGS